MDQARPRARPGLSVALGSGVGSAALICIFSLALLQQLIGIENILPWNTAWLQSGDPAVEQVGWELFRKASWHWPLGKFFEYVDTKGTSIVFVDAIPLLALPMKLLVPRSTQEFQYFGTWMALSYMLQGFLARGIALNFRADRITATAVGLLAILSPVMMYRTAGHFSLTAHWLMLTVIWAATLPKARLSTGLRVSLLTLPVVLAAGVHFYLLVICLTLFVGALARDVLQKTLSFRQAIVGLGTCLVTTIAMMYVWGYFVLPLGAGKTVGFGEYSTNLNSIFNGLGTSLFMRAWPMLIPNQYEGYAYFGLGYFLLIPCLALPLHRSRRRELIPWLVGAYVVAAYLIAALPVVAFGHYPILNLNEFKPVLEIVFGYTRANGRLFWGGFYIALLYLVYRLVVWPARPSAKWVWLGIAVTVQWLDLTPLMSHIFRNYYDARAHAVDLASPFWIAAGKRYAEIDVIPRLPDVADAYVALGRAAFKNGLRIDAGGMARVDRPRLDREETELIKRFQEGKLDPNVVYVLADKSLALSADLPQGKTGIGMVDGWLVVAPNWFALPAEPAIGLEPYRAPRYSSLPLGQTVAFSDPHNRKYLGPGWRRTDSSGVWGAAKDASIRFRASAGAKQVRLHGRALLNAHKPDIAVVLTVDGKPEPHQKIDVKAPYDRDLVAPLPPCSKVEGCDVQVHVAVDNIASAAEIGAFADDFRPLGFGLESMALH